MRVGLITGEYPPDQGGVGDFTHELGQALVMLGHGVHVLTTAQDAPHATRDRAIVHRRIRAWRWGCWRQVLRIAREERLHVLDVQFQTAAYRMHPAIHFVPRRRGRPPVVVTFHDLKVPYLFPKAGPLRRWTVHLLARRADGVIVTNREDELELLNLKPHLQNLTLIPIGSNITPHLPDGYDRDAWRSRWRVAPDDILLGYFGFLNERKGGEDLIETLAALVARGYSAHLLLIGGQVGSSDPTNMAYAERVERLITARGLLERIHRTGFVSPAEVSANLAAVDTCVLPYRDGVSLRHGSLHACLAHGRPIVTTQPIMETPEFCDGETVLLVPAQDIEAMADGVARLASDRDLRSQLEEASAALAAEFTWDRIAARTAAFFEEILDAA